MAVEGHVARLVESGAVGEGLRGCAVGGDERDCGDCMDFEHCR